MSNGTEIATVERQGQAAVRFEQTSGLVREALLNPNLNADNARVLAELLNSQEDRMLAAEFNRDFNRALMEMPVITKAGIITIPAKDGKPARTQGRFARFEDIDRVVRPILNRHNMAMRFEIGDAGGAITVRPILSHINGHTERGEAMRVPLDTSGAKNNAQGAGSAATYGKRYTMCGMLNIVTEGTDDDGSLGKYEIAMPHERELVVLAEAEEAAEAGNYAEWYKTQGVKDRAWLVGEGHHARLGGEPLALPGSSAPRRADPPARQQQQESPTQQQERPQERHHAAGRTTTHDINTPGGWTAQYVDDMGAAASIDEVERIKARGAKGLRQLSEGHQPLWDKCDAAEVEARDRINGEG